MLWAFGAGDTFTFSDITRNILQYEHTGLTAEDDSMAFSVTDGISMATATVQVAVAEVGGDGPRRDPNALLAMEVSEKSSTVITRSHLAYKVRLSQIITPERYERMLREREIERDTSFNEKVYRQSVENWQSC